MKQWAHTKCFITRRIARMMDPITKGGQENYKRKTPPVVKEMKANKWNPKAGHTKQEIKYTNLSSAVHNYK